MFPYDADDPFKSFPPMQSSNQMDSSRDVETPLTTKRQRLLENTTPSFSLSVPASSSFHNNSISQLQNNDPRNEFDPDDTVWIPPSSLFSAFSTLVSTFKQSESPTLPFFTLSQDTQYTHLLQALAASSTTADDNDDTKEVIISNNENLCVTPPTTAPSFLNFPPLRHVISLLFFCETLRITAQLDKTLPAVSRQVLPYQRREYRYEYERHMPESLAQHLLQSSSPSSSIQPIVITPSFSSERFPSTTQQFTQLIRDTNHSNNKQCPISISAMISQITGNECKITVSTLYQQYNTWVQNHRIFMESYDVSPLLSSSHQDNNSENHQTTTNTTTTPLPTPSNAYFVPMTSFQFISALFLIANYGSDLYTISSVDHALLRSTLHPEGLQIGVGSSVHNSLEIKQQLHNSAPIIATSTIPPSTGIIVPPLPSTASGKPTATSVQPSASFPVPCRPPTTPHQNIRSFRLEYLSLCFLGNNITVTPDLLQNSLLRQLSSNFSQQFSAVNDQYSDEIGTLCSTVQSCNLILSLVRITMVLSRIHYSLLVEQQCVLSFHLAQKKSIVEILTKQCEELVNTIESNYNNNSINDDSDINTQFELKLAKLSTTKKQFIGYVDWLQRHKGYTDRMVIRYEDYIKQYLYPPTAATYPVVLLQQLQAKTYPDRDDTNINILPTTTTTFQKQKQNQNQNQEGCSASYTQLFQSAPTSSTQQSSWVQTSTQSSSQFHISSSSSTSTSTIKTTEPTSQTSNQPPSTPPLNPRPTAPSLLSTGQVSPGLISCTTEQSALGTNDDTGSQFAPPSPSVFLPQDDISGGLDRCDLLFHRTVAALGTKHTLLPFLSQIQRSISPHSPQTTTKSTTSLPPPLWTSQSMTLLFSLFAHPSQYPKSISAFAPSLLHEATVRLLLPTYDLTMPPDEASSSRTLSSKSPPRDPTFAWVALKLSGNWPFQSIVQYQSLGFVPVKITPTTPQSTGSRSGSTPRTWQNLPPQIKPSLPPYTSQRQASASNDLASLTVKSRLTPTSTLDKSRTTIPRAPTSTLQTPTTTAATHLSQQDLSQFHSNRPEPSFLTSSESYISAQYRPIDTTQQCFSTPTKSPRKSPSTRLLEASPGRHKQFSSRHSQSSTPSSTSGATSYNNNHLTTPTSRTHTQSFLGYGTTAGLTPSSSSILSSEQQHALQQLSVPKKLQLTTQIHAFEEEHRFRTFLHNVLSSTQQFNNIVTLLRGMTIDQLPKKSDDRDIGIFIDVDTPATKLTEHGSAFTTPTENHSQQDQIPAPSVTTFNSDEEHIHSFSQTISDEMRICIQYGHNLTTPARLLYHLFCKTSWFYHQLDQQSFGGESWFTRYPQWPPQHDAEFLPDCLPVFNSTTTTIPPSTPSTTTPPTDQFTVPMPSTPSTTQCAPPQRTQQQRELPTITPYHYFVPPGELATDPPVPTVAAPYYPPRSPSFLYYGCLDWVLSAPSSSQSTSDETSTTLDETKKIASNATHCELLALLGFPSHQSFMTAIDTLMYYFGSTMQGSEKETQIYGQAARYRQYDSDIMTLFDTCQSDWNVLAMPPSTSSNRQTGPYSEPPVHIDSLAAVLQFRNARNNLLSTSSLVYLLAFWPVQAFFRSAPNLSQSFRNNVRPPPAPDTTDPASLRFHDFRLRVVSMLRNPSRWSTIRLQTTLSESQLLWDIEYPVRPALSYYLTLMMWIIQSCEGFFRDQYHALTASIRGTVDNGVAPSLSDIEYSQLLTRYPSLSTPYWDHCRRAASLFPKLLSVDKFDTYLLSGTNKYATPNATLISPAATQVAVKQMMEMPTKSIFSTAQLRRMKQIQQSMNMPTPSSTHSTPQSTHRYGNGPLNASPRTGGSHPRQTNSSIESQFGDNISHRSRRDNSDTIAVDDDPLPHITATATTTVSGSFVGLSWHGTSLASDSSNE